MDLYTDENNETEPLMYALQVPTLDKISDMLKSPTDILTFVFSLTGIVANCSTIAATARIPQERVYRNCEPRIFTNFKIIISLALSDTLILVALLLHQMLYILLPRNDCVVLARRLFLDMGLLTTLLNLLAMAFDHYLAIACPIFHNYRMTKCQANFAIMGIWFSSAASCLLDVLIGYIHMDKENDHLCRVVLYDSDLEILIVGFILVALLLIVYLYMSIHVKLHARACLARHYLKSKKALFTTVLLIGTFVIFWMPQCIFQIYIYCLDEQNLLLHIEAIYKTEKILFCILQLNSLADPLIYAIRLPKIRAGCKTICNRGARQRADSMESNKQSETTVPLTSATVYV